MPLSREAVIVSYARTGLTKAGRGRFCNTHGAVLAGHSIRQAIARSGLRPDQIEEVVVGCGLPEGVTGHNIARLSALYAGCPPETSGLTVSRFCASGLDAISQAVAQIRLYGAETTIGAGVESISLVQMGGLWDKHLSMQDDLLKTYPALWMSMIELGETLALQAGIDRENQDLYAFQSHQRYAKAKSQGLFSAEIIPVYSHDNNLILEDETPRAVSLEKLSKLKPLHKDSGTLTAGNICQLADGGAALVFMEASAAERRGLAPLGALRGFAVSGCEPELMGMAPVATIRKLLQRHGLKVEDIDLWEVNEAFSSQCLYVRDSLHIDPERFNVNGGAMAIGHPYGMSGIRCTGHMLFEGKRRKAKMGIVAMCVCGGLGVAALFEIF